MAIVGARVAWRTCKFDFLRYGTVVAVVPAGERADPYIKALGKGYYSSACRTIDEHGNGRVRDTESYLIAGAQNPHNQIRLYWPKPQWVKVLACVK